MLSKLSHRQKFLVEMKLFELNLIPCLCNQEKRAFIEGLDKHEFRQYTRRFRKLKKKISRKLSIGYKILDERFIFCLIAYVNDMGNHNEEEQIEAFIKSANGDLAKFDAGAVNFLKLEQN